MKVHPELKSVIHQMVSDWGLVDVLRALEEITSDSLAELKSGADGEDGKEYGEAYEQVAEKVAAARQTAEFTI